MIDKVKCLWSIFEECIWIYGFALMHILRIFERDMFKLTKNISRGKITSMKLKHIFCGLAGFSESYISDCKGGDVLC